MIAISAESTVDLTDEIKEKYKIETVPFSVMLGENVLYDGEVKCKEIIDYVNTNKTLPKTSAVNQVQYEEHFEKLLKTNQAVIHFTLSSELSSAYNNAINASKKYNNVYVIDSRSLSTGIALLAIYARELAEEHEDAKEIVEKVEKRIDKVQASFVLNRVDYLYKGGRCSALMYLGANILKIRPQIIVKDGKMISGKKYRGNYEKVVKSYVMDTLEEFNSPDLKRVFLTTTTATLELIESVKQTLVEYGFKEILITNAGATITSHCGEDCLGILYINDGKEQ